MRRIHYIGLFIILIIAQACNDKRKAKNYNHQVSVDGDALVFIRKAAESGIAEVEASSIARQTSKNPKVVQFATMIADQHSRINDELKSLQSRNLISSDDTISMEKQQEIAAIAKKSGVEFDRDYVSMMVKDHEEAVTLFNSGATIRTASVNKFANKFLPEIKAHLDSAKQILAGLK